MAVAALVMAASVAVAVTGKTTTNKLKGDIEGDANGKVSMKIVVKDGEPVKAKKVKVSNLDYECPNTDETGERTFQFAKIALSPRLDRGVIYVFDKGVKNGDETYTISGETAKGTKVEGEASVRIDEPGNPCTSENLPGDPEPNGRYTAKKK